MLAIILMISLCVSAFALSLTPTADKTSIAQGETITVTLSFDEQIEDIASAEARLYLMIPSLSLIAESALTVIPTLLKM